MNREKKLVKNTFILAIGSFLPRLASFVTLPILTGYLTQEEYGTYDLINVLVGLLLPAVTLQLQTAAFRFLIDSRDDEKKKEDIISNIFIYITLSSLVALVITYFVLSNSNPAIRFFICLYFFADILTNTSRQIVRGLAHNLSYSISAIVSSFSKMLFAIVFVLIYKGGLLGATLALLLSEILSFAYLFFKEKIYKYIKIKAYNFKLLKELMAYSWPMVPNSMSMWVMRVSDRLVVTAFLGMTSNAIYSVANKIPSLIAIAQSVFSMAWQENASIASKDEDASAYYSTMFGKIFDFMAGSFGLLIAATPLLFRLLVRGNYDESYPQIPILLIAMFYSTIFGYLGGVYVALKKTKNVGITTTIAAGLNLIIDLALIKNIGIYAASISTLLSYLFLSIYRMYDINKTIKIKYNYKRILSISCVFIFMVVLCYKNTLFFNLINVIVSIVLAWILEKELLITIITRVKSKIKI